MSTNSLKFYGDKLRFARILNGLTQQELGERAVVTRQFIHQLENELKTPANDVLDIFCEELRVKKNFFFTPMEREIKLEQCHFRKRQTVPIKLAVRVVNYAQTLEKLIDLLHDYLELPLPNFPKIPNSSTDYSIAEIEAAANACRQLWGLGLDTPIANMVRVLEHAGVVVAEFSNISSKVDALSVNERYPIAIRNNTKESICRFRFDLAHECGHFVLHQAVITGDHITESEADKFASEFLFPRVAFIREFPDFTNRQNLDWTIIYNLKVRWGMSVRAIIYKAHSLGLITARQYRSANIWLNKTRQTKEERKDEDIALEQPELLKNSIEILQSHLGIHFNQLADILDIEPDFLSEITGIQSQLQYDNTNIVPFSKYR